MLEIVQRNTIRLNSLIARVIEEQKLLQHARAQSVFAAKVKKQQLDLWPLVEELIHDFQGLIESKSIHARNEVPHDCSIFADPVLIMHVFQNLLSNAIEYTRHGEITIGAAVSNANRLVRCWVLDSGSGIAQERIEKVFDKLETGREEDGGLGLGLAIVKQVVETHGGQIWVKSMLGQGSTFEFTLPSEDAVAASSRSTGGTA